jgi:hypothetical protein
MLGLTALTAQSSAAVMYLRDILGYSAGHIMFLIGSGSLLIAMFIGSLGRRADRYGSSPVMIELLLAHSLVALLWLGLIPGFNWTDPLALLVVAGAAFFNAGFLTVATRGMMCRVRELGRVGYTNLWIFGRPSDRQVGNARFSPLLYHFRNRRDPGRFHSAASATGRRQGADPQPGRSARPGATLAFPGPRALVEPGVAGRERRKTGKPSVTWRALRPLGD